MRKPDVDVREVGCSETGKPMAKIPLWMADVQVKFISDEAKQKHPSTGLAALEPLRRSIVPAGELEEIKESVVADLDDVESETAENDEVEEEAAADDFEE